MKATLYDTRKETQQNPLEALRHFLDLTQAELGSLCGMSQSAISKRESSDRIKLGLLMKAANAVDMQITCELIPRETGEK